MINIRHPRHVALGVILSATARRGLGSLRLAAGLRIQNTRFLRSLQSSRAKHGQAAWKKEGIHLLRAVSMSWARLKRNSKPLPMLAAEHSTNSKALALRHFSMGPATPNDTPLAMRRSWVASPASCRFREPEEFRRDGAHTCQTGDRALKA